LLLIVALSVALAGGGALWLRSQLRQSLPLLDGEAILPGLAGPVAVDRDGLGIPWVRASGRADAARALGFLHAQDRFFQMDLARRDAAGELAELVGAIALDRDRGRRLHRFRSLARKVLERSSPEVQAIVTAYTEGVNRGLAALAARPFEYLALRVPPVSWRPEDSVLVLYSMFLDLHDESGAREARLGLMHDLLPAGLVAFLAPPGDEWDGPIVGPAFEPPPVPGPDVFDLRSSRTQSSTSRPSPVQPAVTPADWPVEPVDDIASPGGSNNWAVAGRLTPNGSAVVANDMHLSIGIPNIWYRARITWRDGAEEPEVAGVTLPGLPAVVVGSNTHVAWGFTNSWGDWIDLVVIDPDPDDPNRYLTPDGPRAFGSDVETIHVKDGDSTRLEIETTIWGPVIDRDHRGRRRVARWTAYDLDAVNLDFVGLERARTLDDAMAAAVRLGIPPQNIVIGDRQGRIGWTIAGRIPRRIGFDGRVPASWADGRRRWDGWLPYEEYPAVADPPLGRIWTANNRVVDGVGYARIGDGGLDHGARARQIRDALVHIDVATPASMLAIQLDDRALLLERWRTVLLDALTPDAIADNPGRASFRRLVETTWTGRASVDSAAYRFVRTFRLVLARDVLGALTSACTNADARFNVLASRMFETPLWRLVQARPTHLLHPRHADWQAQLMAAVDATIAEVTEDGAHAIDSRTWGAYNAPVIRHPLSRALPVGGRWLDIPAKPIGGDNDMPRVQTLVFGATERMVVSPGHEPEGILHMPVGQSGHPLSRHYRDSHAAWVEGRPTPFLPTAAMHRLTLVP
jgi:penicillin amidase